MGSVVKMEEKWSVDKLDGGNWITWKFQMRHLLLAKGLHVEINMSMGLRLLQQRQMRGPAQSIMRNLREHSPLWLWHHNCT